MADKNKNIFINLIGKDQFSKVALTVKGRLQGLKQVGDKVATALAGLGVASVGVGAAMVKQAGDLEATRKGFKNLLGSAEKAEAAVKSLQKQAANTPFEFTGLAKASVLLTTVTKNAPKSERLILNIGKALSAAGKGQEELDRVAVNLQQIGSLGRASLMDIRQFAFAGIPIFDMLAQATGKNGKELEDYIAKGKVSFKMLEDMFNKAGEGNGRFANSFSEMMGTFNQQVSNLKDNWAIFAAEFAEKTGLFDFVKGLLAELNTLITENKDQIIEWGKKAGEAMKAGVEKVGPALQKIVDAISKIEPDSVDMFLRVIAVIAAAGLGASIVANLNPVVLIISALALNFQLAYENAKKLMELFQLWDQNKAIDRAINKINAGRMAKDAAAKLNVSPLSPKSGGGSDIFKSPLNNAQGTSFFGGGITTVGEMGREQVMLPRGTKILNNKQSSGGGITVNVNAPVYGVDNLIATITSAVTTAQSRENKLADFNLL